jgi:putative FmdB family regulatory protein
MPFYEYECSSCRFYVEVLQKISEQPLKKCPSCGKNALKKLVSAPVFRLKGSGWYETDFKSDQENKRNLANTEKEGKEPKPAEADAKSDAKSDAKADAKVEGTEAKAESKTDGAPAAAKPAPGGTAKTATRSGNKAKSKGAARGKSAGSRGSTSSRSKSSAKRRRGR